MLAIDTLLLQPCCALAKCKACQTPWVYEFVVGKQGKKEYPHLQNPSKGKQRGDPRMETNEALQTALGQVAEAELLTLVKSLNELRAGDLKGLEERVLATAFAIGRGLLACLLSHHQPAERPAARRVGSCGHRQRLVGQRSKQLLTALGKISFPRPYYQCVQEAAKQQAEGKEPREPACSHGEAPADALWGVQARRTSPKGHE